jgi:hypothetical protein
MSSAGRDGGEKGGRETDHLTPQFLVGNQKHYFTNISRIDSAMVGRNSWIVEEHELIKKIITKLRQDLRGGSSKVTNGNWSG